MLDVLLKRVVIKKVKVSRVLARVIALWRHNMADVAELGRKSTELPFCTKWLLDNLGIQKCETFYN